MDDGALYRTHMIRKQAAMDIAGLASADDGDTSVIYVKEQDIDNHLIWCDRNDNGIHEPKPPMEQITATVPHMYLLVPVFTTPWAYYPLVTFRVVITTPQRVVLSTR